MKLVMDDDDSDEEVKIEWSLINKCNKRFFVVMNLARTYTANFTNYDFVNRPHVTGSPSGFNLEEKYLFYETLIDCGVPI